jgi:hypothetical protein
VARLGPRDLERLAPLLAELRSLPSLRERSPGTFTRGGGAFLHFHALSTGLATDVKAGGDWLRHDVDRADGRRALLRDVRRILGGDTADLAGHRA